MRMCSLGPRIEVLNLADMDFLCLVYFCICTRKSKDQSLHLPRLNSKIRIKFRHFLCKALPIRIRRRSRG